MNQTLRELAPALVMAAIILAIAAALGQTQTEPPKVQPTPPASSAYERDEALDWAWGVVQGEK